MLKESPTCRSDPQMTQMDADVKSGKHYAQGVSKVSEWIHGWLGEHGGKANTV